MKKSVDFIIVGAGLAGTTIAFQLWQKKYKICVINADERYNSSDVAGGIVNPITGRNMQKSWNIDAILPYSKHYYEMLSSTYKCIFFNEVPILKILDSVEHQNNWESNLSMHENDKYFGNISKHENENIINPYFVGEIKETFWVNIKEYKNSIKNIIGDDAQIIEEQFLFSEFKPEHNLYKDIQYKYIIFAEGYKGRYNPYFSAIPWTFAKGELLEIYSPKLNLFNILSKHISIIPLGGDIYKVGATFNWSDMDTIPTEIGKAELIDKLALIINSDYNIVAHYAGIRPTSKDRKPIIGRSEDFDNLFIFNGLGSKGVSLAPYYANILIQHIISKIEIPKEVDTARFFNKKK